MNVSKSGILYRLAKKGGMADGRTAWGPQPRYYSTTSCDFLSSIGKQLSKYLVYGLLLLWIIIAEVFAIVQLLILPVFPHFLHNISKTSDYMLVLISPSPVLMVLTSICIIVALLAFIIGIIVIPFIQWMICDIIPRLSEPRWVRVPVMAGRVLNSVFMQGLLFLYKAWRDKICIPIDFVD